MSMRDRFDRIDKMGNKMAAVLVAFTMIAFILILTEPFSNNRECTCGPFVLTEFVEEGRTLSMECRIDETTKSVKYICIALPSNLFFVEKIGDPVFLNTSAGMNNG